MVLFNHSTRELTAKIVYYGAGLCGKTTNLRLLHERLEKGTAGRLLSLATAQDRTIYFDLLPVELGNIKGYTVRFQLCTVPGQVFYNETRKLVLRGVDGIVFVVDSQWSMLSHNLESFQNLRENLRDADLALESIPLVIQYNKRDLPGVLSVDALQESLGFQSYPFVEAVASAGRGVVETFKLISKLTFVDLLRRLQRGSGAEEPTVLTEGPRRDHLEATAIQPNRPRPVSSPVPAGPRSGADASWRRIFALSERRAEAPSPVVTAPPTPRPSPPPTAEAPFDTAGSTWQLPQGDEIFGDEPIPAPPEAATAPPPVEAFEPGPFSEPTMTPPITEPQAIAQEEAFHVEPMEEPRLEVPEAIAGGAAFAEEPVPVELEPVAVEPEPPVMPEAEASAAGEAVATALEEAIALLHAATEGLRAEMDEVRAELARVASEAAGTDAVAALQQHVADLSADGLRRGELREELEPLRDRLEALASAAAGIEAVEGLSGRLDLLAATVATAAPRETTATVEAVEALDRRLGGVTESVARFEEMEQRLRSDLEASLVRLREELWPVRSEITELRQALAAQLERHDGALATHRVELAGELGAARGELGTLAERSARELAELREHVQGELRRLESTPSPLQPEIASLRADLETRTKTIGEVFDAFHTRLSEEMAAAREGARAELRRLEGQQRDLLEKMGELEGAVGRIASGSEEIQRRNEERVSSAEERTRRLMESIRRALEEVST